MRNGRERKPSNITVTTVDLDKLIAEHQGTWQTFPDLAKYDEFYFPTKLGFVETDEGLFFIDSEGVGGTGPITDIDPLQANLYGTYINDEGKKCRPIIPIDYINLTPELLRHYAGEQVQLEKFVRTFGRRLECNYRASVEFFKSKRLVPAPDSA